MMTGIVAAQVLKGLLMCLALPVSAGVSSHGCELFDRPFRAPDRFSGHRTASLHTVKDGARKNFAEYFEAYFPEAIEQTGTIIAGSFFERTIRTG
jgi:hypothetical protein